MKRHKVAQAVPPPAPPYLTPGSRALWDAVVTPAMKPGRLVLIETALAARDRAEDARQRIAVEGMTLPATKTGMVHVNPLVKVEKDARQQFASVWAGLGLRW